MVRFLEAQGLQDVTLVGHSFGGTIVQRLAVEAPERIGRMVFLDALILEDGQSVYDNLPSEYVRLFEQLTSTSTDDSMLIPWDIWRNSFLQDAPEPFARRCWMNLSPEPNQVNRDRLELARFDSLDVPRSFIFCRQDLALPPGSFHPRMSSRLGSFTLLEMDGSHEVMFTRPSELAERLLQAALS
jgi:pimeloyl-ACP methyl ester carboxylesterase